MSKPTYLSKSHELHSRDKKKHYKTKKLVTWYTQSTIGVSRKIRNDYSDMDYISKLDQKSLEFIKAFNREYYNADFKHKYKVLHKRKKQRKTCYDNNNRLNRDIYALTKCRGRLVTMGVDPEWDGTQLGKRREQSNG